MATRRSAPNLNPGEPVAMNTGRPSTNAPGPSLEFRNAGGMPGNHPGFASSASNSGNIDLNDFPALGSQGAQVTSGASNLNLFSPHATQTPSGLSNSSMKLGMMGMLSRNAPFTHDEFPALNRTQNSVRESRASAHGVPSAMHLMDHAAPVAWQQDQPQQQRQNLVRCIHLRKAQDLARKHNLPAPQSASTLDQPTASSAWMQSYGNPSATGLNRIGMPRNGNISSGAIRVDGSLDSDTKQHDTPGNDASEHASYVASNEGMAQQPIDQVLYSPADRFGLVGLVSLIKTQDPDMSMLTMGNNLQSLGMNLDSSDSLAASFVAPWSRDPALASMQVEPAYQLPSCYNVQPPPPAQTKVASFSDETLFLIFYSTPRDALQEVAAQELYARNWRYHKGLHLWLTKEQNTEPVQKTSTYERGTYVFFDPGSWEKVSKNFVLMYEMLEEKPSARALQPTMPSQQPTPGRNASGGNSSRRDTSPSAHSSPQTSFA